MVSTTINQSGDNGSAELQPGITPDALLAAHGDELYRLARARLPLQEAAEDAVQETLLAALKRPADLAAAANPRAWLMGILRHKIADWFRRGRRETPFSELGDEAGDADDEGFLDRFFDDRGHWLSAPPRWKTNPAAVLTDIRFTETLHECMAKLPGRHAEVFRLREIEGLETDEACEVLGITATNLHATLHRARFRLRACLAKNWTLEGDVK